VEQTTELLREFARPGPLGGSGLSSNGRPTIPARLNSDALLQAEQPEGMAGQMGSYGDFAMEDDRGPPWMRSRHLFPAEGEQ